MTESPSVAYDLANGVAHIELNRPDAFNARWICHWPARSATWSRQLHRTTK